MQLFLGCTSQVPTFYRFKLFENTPVAALAKAADNEDVPAIADFCKTYAGDVNYQEKRYGNTVLITAAANGKVNAVKALLANGANFNTINESGEQAIHVAADGPFANELRYEVLKSLLDAGADVNSVLYGLGDNKAYVSIPLAILNDGDEASFNLLVQRGANLYFKANNTFMVWAKCLNTLSCDYLAIILQLVKSKNYPIPTYITTDENDKPIEIIKYLYKSIEFNSNPCKTKQLELISYLKKINFPNNQLYKDTSFNHLNPHRNDPN